MKVGDRVILKKYESNDSFFWHKDCNKYLDKEVIVIRLDYDDNSFEFLYNGDTDWWLQSACEPVKRDRYFLFGYVSDENTGNTWLKNSEGKFPSHSYIVEFIKDKLSTKNAAVISIFEFKSEQDYLDFTSNE